MLSKNTFGYIKLLEKEKTKENRKKEKKKKLFVYHRLIFLIWNISFKY